MVKPWTLNRSGYRARNVIESYFGRIKRKRGVACCYQQLAHVYLNPNLLACIHITAKQSKHALVFTILPSNSQLRRRLITCPRLQALL